MKFFITGSTGFVGGQLLNRLNNQDIYCHKRGENISAVKDFKPDVIFHCAAELNNPEKMFESNIKLTYDLLEASKYVNYKKLIYIGSSSEYGRKINPIKETDFLYPDTMYEATKGASSLLCLGYSKIYKKPITVVRPFSLYGIGQPENKLIPSIYKAFKNSETIKIVSFASHDWVYIDDFIDSLINLINNQTDRDVVNIGTGVQHTNKEVLECFEKILEKDIPYKEIQTLKSYDSGNWQCDTTYAREKHNFLAKYNLETGLRKYVNYKKINGN